MKTWIAIAVAMFGMLACVHPRKTEQMCTYAGMETIPASSPECVPPAPPPPPPPPPMMIMCQYAGLESLSASDPECRKPTPMTHPAPDPGMPQFPWPVPKPSRSSTLPPRLCRNPRDTTVRGSWNLIQAAFHRSGYPDEERTFTIGNGEGFVILGRMEAIEKDASPKIGPNRWGDPLATDQAAFSIHDWFTELFSRVTGRYRVIAIVMTSRPLLMTPAITTLARINAVADEGALGPPPREMGARAIQSDVNCFALIYELERPGLPKNTHIVYPSPHPAREHLLKAKMWSKAQLEIQ